MRNATDRTRRLVISKEKGQPHNPAPAEKPQQPGHDGLGAAAAVGRLHFGGFRRGGARDAGSETLGLDKKQRSYQRAGMRRSAHEAYFTVHGDPVTHALLRAVSPFLATLCWASPGRSPAGLQPSVRRKLPRPPGPSVPWPRFSAQSRDRLSSRSNSSPRHAASSVGTDKSLRWPCEYEARASKPYFRPAGRRYYSLDGPERCLPKPPAGGSLFVTSGPLGAFGTLCARFFTSARRLR